MLRQGIALLFAIFVLDCNAFAWAQPNRSVSSEAGHAPPHKLPDDFKINLMIRTAVIAVNHANKTNNYTVLRDLGSPRFKEANSAEKLQTIFAGLRKTKFDLAPVLFFTPQMLAPPAVTNSDMLRLTGFFDTVPQRVSFDLLFESVNEEWLIYGINIATQGSPAAGAEKVSPPPSDSPE